MKFLPFLGVHFLFFQKLLKYRLKWKIPAKNGQNTDAIPEYRQKSQNTEKYRKYRQKSSRFYIQIKLKMLFLRFSGHSECRGKIPISVFLPALLIIFKRIIKKSELLDLGI